MFNRYPVLGLILTLGLAACGGGGSGGSSDSDVGSGDPPPPPPSDPPPTMEPTSTLTTETHTCENGQAGDFACHGIALLSRVPLDAMDGSLGNDLWGWVDSQTDREYALMGMSNGTAFVDVSEPLNPVFLGRLPTQTDNSDWRDIKVYADHAYIVADGAGAHGLQIFDLTRLRDQTTEQTFLADHVYDGFEHAHNLAINEESGFVYAVSTNTCEGGLHILDLSTPINPLFVGCHRVFRTHDTQCVNYIGLDAEYQGREICFSANEGAFEIVDVSSKSSPMALSSTTYSDLAYVHQGWLTEDHRFFVLGDELDELYFNQRTRTHVFEIASLEAPRYVYAFEHDTQAIDHNMYVLGERVFQANYSVGLQVLEFGDLSNQEMEVIASFDTFPAHNEVKFNGAWSVYPYLPSGVMLVSDMTNGLFVLALE